MIMDTKQKIAIVEDDPTFREFLVQELKEQYSVQILECYEDAEIGIKDDVDLVILDLRIPLKKGQTAPPMRSDEMPLGVRLLEHLKAKRSDLDVIVCTGEVIQTKPIIEIMKKGASDYFIKDQDLPGRIFKTVDTLIEKSIFVALPETTGARDGILSPFST